MGTLPSAFVDLDYQDIYVGVPVADEPVSTIGDNSNFVWAAFCPQLGGIAHSVPVGTGAAGARTALWIFPLPAHQDGFELEITVSVDNSSGLAAADVQVDTIADGDTDSTTVGAGVRTFVQLYVDAPAAEDVLVVSTDADANPGYTSCTVTYLDKKGDIVAYTQAASGFRFTLPATEFASDRPVTDEQINRWLRNPRRVWLDRTSIAASAGDSLAAGGVLSPALRYSQVASARTINLPLQIDVPFECNLRWQAYYIGPPDATIRVKDMLTLNEQDFGAPIDAALPAWNGPYAYNEVTFTDCAPGRRAFEVSLIGDDSDPCVLYSLIAWVER